MCDDAVKLVRTDSLLGLGSGSTVALFVRALGLHAQKEGMSIAFIPSSLQIQLVAEEYDMKMVSSDRIPEIDLAVDGADQIDGRFNMIKGGGGALLRERVLLTGAKRAVILADESKYSKDLDRPVPIEVVPFARSLVGKRLAELGGKARLRLLDKGYPYVTENGNIILDASFGKIDEPSKLFLRLKQIAGVAEVGLFDGSRMGFIRANRDGSVERLGALL